MQHCDFMLLFNPSVFKQNALLSMKNCSGGYMHVPWGLPVGEWMNFHCRTFCAWSTCTFGTEMLWVCQQHAAQPLIYISWAWWGAEKSEQVSGTSCYGQITWHLIQTNQTCFWLGSVDLGDSVQSGPMLSFTSAWRIKWLEGALGLSIAPCY